MADERFVADSTDAHGKCEAADEITGEVLLSKHVVWRSPDGSHTMRFNLSTLRKIAARAGEWRGPPHFRSKMDEGMKQQILRKFGKRALFAVWNGGGPGSASQAPGGSVGSDGSSSFIRGGEDYAAEDGYFMQQLAEFDARRLTDVHNLYVCPICFHWLRTVEPEPEEQFEPAAAAAAGSSKAGGSSSSNGKKKQRIVIAMTRRRRRARRSRKARRWRMTRRTSLRRASRLALYGSSMICHWHKKMELPPEVGAAQMCFRKQAELTQHLRHAHCLTEKAMKGTRERLGAYVIRGGDGLVHKWLNRLSTDSSQATPNRRKRSITDGHVRGYWKSGVERIASSQDTNEAWWFSRAALFRALYDEVEAQSYGDGYAAEADEALFGDRLAAAKAPARPCGAASSKEARVWDGGVGGSGVWRWR